MPSTACYYAANRGDNPRKPVTDSLIPVCALRGVRLFVFFDFASSSAYILPSSWLWGKENAARQASLLGPVGR